MSRHRMPERRRSQVVAAEEEKEGKTREEKLNEQSNINHV